MTEDTNMPNEIYAAYDLNGTTYGVSVIKSKWDGVYILDLYYIKNKKKIHWKSVKSGDITGNISTMIKIFESVLPFLGSKLKGMIFHLPPKFQSERFVKMLERIIKKTHITTFRTLPVTKTTPNATNYLFMIRKTIKPESIFKGVHFSKHFDFDSKNQVIGIGTDIIDQADYIKKPKVALSIVPSEVHAFGKIKIDFTSPDELIMMLQDATDNYKANPKKASTVAKENADKFDFDAMKDVTPTIKNVFYENDTEQNLTLSPMGTFITISYPLILAYLLPNAYKNISNYGFDEDKISILNLNHVIKSTLDKLPKLITDHLYVSSLGIGTDNQIDFGVEPHKDEVFSSMQKFYKVTKTDLDSLSNIIKKSTPKEVKEEPKPNKPATKLNLGFELIVDMDEFKSSNNSVAGGHKHHIPFKEVSEDINGKKTKVLTMPSVQKWYADDGRFEHKGHKAMVSYTGSAYTDWNSSIRDATTDESLVFDDLEPRVQNLMKYFVSDAPKLDAGIWVYRNCHFKTKAKVGEEVVDSAFLSTSLRSTCSMGDVGNTRLKIYLPKGTKCFPALADSSHPSEDEVILPPFSCLKVTEYEVADNGKHCYVCVMLGSGVETLVNSGSTNLFK